MVPWTDSAGKAYCPGRSHLDDTTSMFNLLNPYIGPTEGIFLAEREPMTYTENGTIQFAPQNVLIVRESLLLEKAFYISNSLAVGIDSTTLQTEKTLHLYWPPVLNDTSPYTRKADQKLYTVKFADQIGNPSRTGLQTSIRPIDKRIGCVPENSSN